MEPSLTVAQAMELIRTLKKKICSQASRIERQVKQQKEADEAKKNILELYTQLLANKKKRVDAIEAERLKLVEKEKQASLAKAHAKAHSEAQRKSKAEKQKRLAKADGLRRKEHEAILKELPTAEKVVAAVTRVLDIARQYVSTVDDLLKYPANSPGPSNEADRIEWLLFKLYEPMKDTNLWLLHYEEFLRLFNKASSIPIQASLLRDTELMKKSRKALKKRAKALKQKTLKMEAATSKFVSSTETNTKLLRDHFTKIGTYGEEVVGDEESGKTEEVPEENEETAAAQQQQQQLVEHGRTLAKACGAIRGCLKLTKLNHIDMLLSMCQCIAFEHRVGTLESKQPIADSGIQFFESSAALLANSTCTSVATRISTILQNTNTSVTEKAKLLKPLFFHATNARPRSLILCKTTTCCVGNVALWNNYFDGASNVPVGSRSEFLENAFSSITSHLYDLTTVNAALANADDHSYIRYIGSEHVVTISLLSFVTNSGQKRLRKQYYSSLTAAKFYRKETEKK